MESSSASNQQAAGPVEHHPSLPRVFRFLGVTLLVWTVCGAILSMIQAHWLDAMWSTDGFGDSEAVMERLESLWAWFKVTDIVGMSLLLIGAAAAVWAADKRRSAQVVLIVATGLIVSSSAVLLTIYFGETDSADEATFLFELKSYLTTGGLATTLLGAAMLARWRWRGLFVGGYLVHVGVGLCTQYLPSETFETITSRFMLSSAIDLVGAGFFSVGLMKTAGLLQAGGSETDHERVVEGSALRLLSKAIGLRIGLSIGGVVLLFILVLSKSFGLVPLCIWIFAGLALAASLYLGWALLSYFALPSSFRSGTAIIVALVGLATAAVIEALSAVNAAELFTLVAKAREATSYWGVPGLSKIEDLQGSLMRYRRITMFFGVISYGAVAYALLSTASRLGDLAAAAKAKTVMVLIGTGAVGAVGLESILSSPNRVDPTVFLGGAVLLLCVGIATLVVLFQVLTALGYGLDSVEDPELGEEATIRP